MPTCPAGHHSNTVDFCDECGAPMNATTQFSALPQPPAGGPPQQQQAGGWFAPEAQPCPECGEPLLDRFCEACGWGPGVAPAIPSGPVPQQAFDPFAGGGAPPPPPSVGAQPGPVPAPFPPQPDPSAQQAPVFPPPDGQFGQPSQPFPPPAAPDGPPAFATPPAQPADPFAAAFPAPQQQAPISGPPAPAPAPMQQHAPGPWQLVADADRAYFERICRMNDLDPNTMQFPAYVPQRFFRLHGPQLLMGRRSASKGINPDIDLSGPPTDAAVSHAHALFIAQPDGSWAVVDVGSSNGTFINEGQQALVRHQPQQLNVGDRVHVGLWTTLTVTTGM